MWVYILLVIAILVIVFWNPVFEHMTNAAVQKKQDFHAAGTDDKTKRPTTWQLPNPKPTKKKAGSLEPPLMGPRVPAVDLNEPSGTNDPTKNGSSVYPDIYGPELLKAPGHLDPLKQPAFPPGPAEPAPYLNDFSSILNK